MLIAGDLLLLLTDDTSGRLSTHPAKVEILLAGANLVELALMGHVHVSPEVVKVIPSAPRPVTLLDAVPPMVIACEGNISCVISQPGKNLQRTLYERLVSSGLIRQRRRILAVIKVDRWPAQDSRHKVQVRQRVIQAVEENTTPDTRSAALIALVHTIEHEPGIVAGPHHERLGHGRPAHSLHSARCRAQPSWGSMWAATDANARASSTDSAGRPPQSSRMLNPNCMASAATASGLRPIAAATLDEGFDEVLPRRGRRGGWLSVGRCPDQQQQACRKDAGDRRRNIFPHLAMVYPRRRQAR